MSLAKAEKSDQFNVMKRYFRPILQSGSPKPDTAVSFAGTEQWIYTAECLARGHAPLRIGLDQVPADVIAAWTQPRGSVAGQACNQPIIMGILNVTPDSFSDGGQFNDPSFAIKHALTMQAAGAGIIDIGGESTRPGAVEVTLQDEIDRTAPVIRTLASELDVPMSIDTRKTAVAEAALAAGARLVNDVSGLTFDPTLLGFCTTIDAPVCIMHSQGSPETMQINPTYDDVILDVYDFLERQMVSMIDAGISKDRIIVDPGIGFGKTIRHNLALLNKISIFHSLGVPVLLGASRKGMIRTISGAEDAQDRMPGSIAIALNALAQGIQIFRVHDVPQTRQAFDLWQAISKGDSYGA